MKGFLTLLLVGLTSLSFANSKNILDIAAEAGNFKTLITALEISGLDKVIREGKSFTVFAPTDEAFAKIPAETLNTVLANQELLKSILLYHVANPAMTAKKVLRLNGIKTLSGKYIINYSAGDVAQLNDSKIIATDIKGKNGIIHVIDTVLLPGENTANNNIEVAPFVEIEKYMGLWYEVYRLPNNFQKGCTDTTATYKLKRNGKVSVVNRCTLENGKKRAGHATAKVVDRKTNARLKVSFVPFLQRWVLFGGDYNIIDVAADYSTAIVGTRDRSNLWFLSRTRDLDEATVNLLKLKATSQGYNVNKLIKTPKYVK